MYSYIQDISKFRIYLLSKGFVPCDTTGNNYVRTMNDDNLVFSVDLKNYRFEATIPDFEYNMMFPQAKRNKVFHLDLSKLTDSGIYEKDIDDFMQDIIVVFNNKS